MAKLQEVKAGLMHDLFSRGVIPDGRLRLTRTEAPHLYQNSPVGWIPKEWEVRPLASFHSARYYIRDRAGGLSHRKRDSICENR